MPKGGFERVPTSDLPTTPMSARSRLTTGSGDEYTETEASDLEQEFGENLSPFMQCYVKAMHFVPLISIVILTLIILALCQSDRPLCLALLTVYLLHHEYCYLIHVTIFSAVGQCKMNQAELVNYKDLHHEMRHVVDDDDDDAADEEGGKVNFFGENDASWEDILHFVIIPNYKEDIEILREALDTISVSTVARDQIGICLAMEERESDSNKKAEKLLKDYKARFRHVIATFHPANIPNEVAGKAANTKWAAERVWEYLSEIGADDDRVIFTVCDADSDFHSSYFEALTYHFLQTPPEQRNEKVFQAPIMHYKNYHAQPSIVKLCSLFVTQHELANLADESSTPLPYSTYSISSKLAKGCGGWDPDWISEDWHMFLKCFIYSAGKVHVHPILLPIVNYTPEDDTWASTIWARWVQAKRHALGIAEMVYLLSSLPHRCSHLSMGELFFFIMKIIPILYKMFAIHIVMATFWIFSTLNGPILLYVLWHPEDDTLGAWRDFWLALNIAVGIFGVLFFIFLNVASITLYNSIQSRIVPPSSNDPLGCVYKSSFVHLLYIIITGVVAAPFMNIAGGLAEWIAALKTAWTHKFEYEVAKKPVYHHNN